MQKPILKKDRKPKSVINLNHSVPGYVYLMFDPKARLTKIGLSRNPKKRRWYLAIEHQSNLKLIASAPTLNMKVSEELMHHLFRKHHQYQNQGLNGFSEWFDAGFFTRILMRLTLFFVVAVTSITSLFLSYKAVVRSFTRRK
jgi:hypothetical protein